jgi:hypothetical protein
MHTSLFLATISLANLCLAEPGVLSLRTFKNHEKHAQALRKRDLDHAQKRAFPVTLQNYPYIGGGFYFVNATVGTPPQEVQLDIDTGSSDVWMFGVHSCDITTSVCAGGVFDETASSSLTLINKGGFEIQYFTAGSGVRGDYITDVFTIGKQTVKNLTMGVATRAESVNTGIMGIGFDTNEAIVGSEEAQGETPQPYPNLLDVMKQEGLVTTRAYSLYLDDLEADTGSIIFGGYDTAKFQGDLGILAIQPDSQSGTYSTFGVILNSVGVTDSTGSTVLSTANMPNVVILDSGTAFTIIPSDLFSELVTYFGAVDDGTFGWIVRCDLSGMTGTLDYQFAGPTGPLVSVPFEELAIPIVDLNNGDVLTDTKGNPVCRLGLSAPSSANEPLLLGDTFLRSAYVVYDLDNLQIGLAQTLFNVTESNIQVISAGTGQNLPGKIASLVTTIEQTKTQGINGAAETLPTGTPTAVNTAIGAGNPEVLTGYKTTYTNRATKLAGGASTTGASGASSTSTSKKNGAATLNTVSGGFWRGMLVQGLIVTAASFIGARVII